MEPVVTSRVQSPPRKAAPLVSVDAATSAPVASARACRKLLPVSPAAKAASNRGLGPRNMGVELAMVKQGGGKAPLLIEVRHQQRGWFAGLKTIVHWVIVGGLKPRLKFRENVRAGTPELEGQIFAGFRDGVNRA